MSSSESELETVSHSESLKRLKTNDPEFYKFLKDNDEKLLDYQDSDEEDLEENSPDGEQLKESEYVNSLTTLEIQNLQTELQNSPTLETCKKAMSLLKITFRHSSQSDKQLAIVDGNFFNDILKLCLVELVPAMSEVLKLPQQVSNDPSKSKTWKKILASVKSYLIDILKVLSYLSEPSTLELILKHIMSLVPYYIPFIKLSRLLIKKMIHIWGTSSEKARLSGFVIMHRVLKRLPSEYHSQVLKQLYFAYVRNSKFSTVSSLPLISFMKRSLAEMYACYPEVAYEHTFLYLRQLSIHLRNAITTKKKESFQVVYNWQYINCVILWSEVICSLYHFEPIKTLVYPLIQLTIGTINVIPTLKYVPLRFHLVKTLINVSSSTKVFIPVAPLILDALSFIDTEKKMMFSKKSANFSCALKASKSELQESGFRDAVVDSASELLLNYFSIYSSSISFPELSFLAIHHLKAFLKKNKNSKYGQKLKSVVDKLQQNSSHILQQRNGVSFQITNTEEIERWEATMLQKGVPLMKHCNADNNKLLCQEPAKKKRKLK